MGHSGNRIGMVVCAAAVLAFAGLAATARAQSDEFTSRVNAPLAAIAEARRSDAVLLPVLAKSAPAPRAVADVHQARLLPASSAGFAEAAAWAKAPEQQAVIEALKKVTEETDWRKAYVFAQPYGVEGVSPELIRAKLYTELGDPPTLAAAQHLYLPALDRLECLVNVEATRLASEGKVDDAIELMTRMSLFSLQVADRRFFAEASWGMNAMMRSLERVRDVAFTDFQGEKKLDLAKLRTIIDRLATDVDKKAKGSGYTDVMRMTLPDGDRVAVEQVIARVYEPKGAVKPDVFARTMAKVGTAGRPLRLFSESARWRGAAATQVSQEEASRLLAGLFNDWHQRWQLNWFDRFQAIEQKFAQLDRNRAMVIATSMPDVSQLRHLRQMVRVEIGGTRAALAALAFRYRNNSFGPAITSARPQWIHELDVDPFNTGSADGFTRPLLNYVRPTLDGVGAGGVESVIVAQVPDSENARFTQRFTEDTVLIYSVGSDNANNVVRSVQNTSTVVRGADYLLWPPVLSLYRQHLTDLELLK